MCIRDSAEIGRLLLRHGALRDLKPAERRLVTAMIGGHPRLLELVDVLLRHGTGALTVDLRRKLADLAAKARIDLEGARTVEDAITDAVRLGTRDILLDQLVGLLTPEEQELLLQAAVSPLPFSAVDLVSARWGEDATPEQHE